MAAVTVVTFRVLLAAGLTLASAGVPARPQVALPAPAAAPAGSLETRLTALRESAKLPAVAGAVFTSAQTDGELLPVEPALFGDNPPLPGPAGRLHMSIADRGVALATNGSIGAQAAIEAALAQLLGGS